VDRNKHDISVTCQKAGYQDVSENLSASYRFGHMANKLIDFNVVGIGVDAVTGADNYYPDDTNIRLIPERPVPAPTAPEVAGSSVSNSNLLPVSESPSSSNQKIGN